MKKIINQLLANKALFIIFALALVLRTYKLGSLPFSLHQDEVMNGYVGRFILLNGKDLYGNSWPLIYFDRFGDYPNVLPMYISGLSTFIFGVNEFAVRFPIALIASLAIFPTYLLAFWIFKDKKTALVASFLLAVTPWHIVLSRATSENIIASTVFLTAIVFLINSIRKERLRLLFFSFGLLFLTYFIYPSFRIITPLSLLPITIFLLIKKPKSRLLITLIAVNLLFFALTFYISKTPWGKGRFDMTSIFNVVSGVGIKQKESIYSTSHTNVLITRLFHNKLVSYGREFLNQYLSYFSPVFLFILGGLPIRYAIPEEGLFYLTFLLIMIIPLIPFLRKRELKINSLLLLYIIYLLLITPIPSALTTNDAPNVHRAALMSILFIFPVAYFYLLIKDISYKKFQMKNLLFILIFVEFVFFWHQYSTHADYYQNIGRNDGEREVIKFVQANQKNYKTIYLPVQGTFPLYYLFYKNDFNPSYAGKFKTDIKIDKIDNIDFMDEACPFKLVKDFILPSFAVGFFDCVEENNFKYSQSIIGKNTFYGFKVMTPLEK